MSDVKQISPLLDNYTMGEAITDRNGVRCCPAIENDTQIQHIVKVISIPASQVQTDALLITGAYEDETSVDAYYKQQADGYCAEVDVLRELASLEGFLPFTASQVVAKEDSIGYDVYFVSPYRQTLERYFYRYSMTHLGAVNLGLDLCAALAVCRWLGYLYVNLKPENVYIADNQQYKIGDLGFVKLDSLKFTSIPDAYRSVYTAPEICDALSALNSTLDVYALGMILYQAFNGGMLPFTSETKPTGDLPAPLYADGEIAEIILKACAPDPAARWQDPIELGQALVSYMQRNGVEDTPIVPLPSTPEEAVAEAQSEIPEDIPDLDDVDYQEVSEDVEEMLVLADDLAAHPVPEVVITSEPANIEELMASAQAQAETEESTDSEDAPDDITEEISDEQAQNESPEPVVTEPAQDVPADTVTEPPIIKKKPVVPIILTVAAILALLAAGVCYYLFVFLKPVHSITLEGDYDDLTVYVSSDLEEGLYVVCADLYGTEYSSAVVYGKAIFHDLTPNMVYTIEVNTDKFHHLTGKTTATYTTPTLTQIQDFTVLQGITVDSAIVQFLVNGTNADDWVITYSAEGVEAKSVQFTGNTQTITGLEEGKSYTFTLSSSNEEMYLGGNLTQTFTPSTPLSAENVIIESFSDGKLSVSWYCPESATQVTWRVRCYNGKGYDNTVTTNESKATFEGLNADDTISVEVSAVGMSEKKTKTITANSFAVTNCKAVMNSKGGLEVSWTTDAEKTVVLYYSIYNSDVNNSIKINTNKVIIADAVPGAKYIFQYMTEDGGAVFHAPFDFTVPAAKSFTCTYPDGGKNYTVGASNMTFSMCKTPSKANWTKDDLKATDYTTTFAPNQKASLVVKLNKNYGISKDTINTLFVIRDVSGKVVTTGFSQSSWTNMWYKYYCELDIPVMPTQSGKYTVSVYFNGMLAGEQAFTIT